MPDNPTDTTTPAPAQPDLQAQQDLKHETKVSRRELLKAIVLCVAIVIVCRSFIIEPFKIPSSSMLPTLAIGDHIFVSKFFFGLTVPLTSVELIPWGNPKRGDVIVFLSPRDSSLHYIKRVIGLPNDEIKIEGKNISINGSLVKTEKLTVPGELANFISANDPRAKFFRETLGDMTHIIQYSSELALEALSSKSWKIPEDSYFVMGDHRDDSYDSRAWGPLKRNYIKGRAEIIWLSLDHQKGWGSVRWSRCGRVVR